MGLRVWGIGVFRVGPIVAVLHIFAVVSHRCCITGPKP